jgi:hypothetical protein
MTGDFGSGKSSFALLLANTLRDASNRLPKGLLERVLEVVPEVKGLHYIPVLVVGNREPMGPAILRGLVSANNVDGRYYRSAFQNLMRINCKLR